MSLSFDWIGWVDGFGGLGVWDCRDDGGSELLTSSSSDRHPF